MSSGLLSVVCAGPGVVVMGGVELLPDIPVPAEPLPDIPVPAAPLEGELMSDLDGSAIGAGVGAGEVVVGAGGGTVFSSFLPQALRPTATRATKRSERFMFFPFRRRSDG
jgi:hypothetical protein